MGKKFSAVRPHKTSHFQKILFRVLNQNPFWSQLLICIIKFWKVSFHCNWFYFGQKLVKTEASQSYKTQHLRGFPRGACYIAWYPKKSSKKTRILITQ